MIRSVLVLLHRYVGLATAIFLVVIGLTGSILAYREPISAFISPELYAPPARGPVLSPFELARRVQAAEPRAEISGWPLNLVARQGREFLGET